MRRYRSRETIRAHFNGDSLPESAAETRRSPSPWRNAPGQRKDRDLPKVSPNLIPAQLAGDIGDEILKLIQGHG